jgi:hypothetical protein
MLDLPFIWIPFELKAARPGDEQLEAGILQARSHFTREIFAATMEQPNHLTDHLLCQRKNVQRLPALTGLKLPLLLKHLR